MKRLTALLTSAALALSMCIMPSDSIKEQQLVIEASAANEIAAGYGRSIPDGDYYIRSRTYFYNVVCPGKKLVPEDRKTVAQVYTEESGINPDNLFTVTYLNNGYYSIVQKGTDMSLDVPLDSDGAMGTKVEYYDYSGKDDPKKTTNNQQWSIEPTQYGYIVRSRYCSYVLDIAGGRPTPRGDLCVYSETAYDPDEDYKIDNQRFLFVPGQEKQITSLDLVAKNYHICSALGSKLWLDAAGYPGDFTAGVNVAMYTQPDEAFFFSVDGYGYYNIKPYVGPSENKYYLSADYGSSTGAFANDGANVYLDVSKSSRDQKPDRAIQWYVVYNKNGTYCFINKLNGYALTMDGTDSTANVCVRQYTGAANQQWLIGTKPPVHKPGDVNGDGQVNLKDLTALKQYLAKWTVDVIPANCDVNGDGSINVKDATLLSQSLANWNVELV